MSLSRVIRAKSFRYAAGELLLIVVGILIALAISDWNDDRLARQQELLLLGEVRMALQADVETLGNDLQGWTETAARLDSLLVVLETDPPYDASMDALFGAAYGLRRANLNTAAYESLKSTGLHVISNSKLRIGIAQVFDYHYEKLVAMNEIEHSTIIELMRPYYLEHFTNLAFHQSATPLNYAKLVSDQYYQNIVEYRLTIVRGNQIAMYTDAIEDMRAVLDMLEDELGQ